MPTSSVTRSGIKNYERYLNILAGAEPFVAPVPAFDLLDEEILLSAQSSVTFSSLSTYAADYQHLQIRATYRDTSGNLFSAVLIRFNADTTSSYAEHFLYGGSSVVSGANATQNEIRIGANMGGGATAGAFSPLVMDILDPFSGSKNTTMRNFGGRLTGSSSQDFVQITSGLYFKTDALTEINIRPESGSLATGSRFSLYGYGKGA